MKLTETKISSEPIYSSDFVNIHRDKVRLVNGNTSFRVVINHAGAVAVLAVTDADEVVLVRQFRYAVGEELLEIPAGKLDRPDEEPIGGAFRELAEETPYTAEKMTPARVFYSAPGFCDEKMHLFIASGLKKNSTLTPDPDELLNTVLMTKDEVKRALKAGDIKDAKTIIALNYWLKD